MKKYRNLTFVLLFFLCSSCSKTSPRQVFEKTVNGSEYLADCKNTYPKKISTQEGFQGIYSGITTTVELVNQFGQPDEYSVINKTEDEYMYIGEELDDNQIFRTTSMDNSDPCGAFAGIGALSARTAPAGKTAYAGRWPVNTAGGYF